MNSLIGKLLIDNRRQAALFLICLCLYFFPAVSHALAPIVLTDTQKSCVLNGYLEVLEDNTKKLTLQDVSSPEISKLFKPLQSARYHGFNQPAYWLRFKLKDLSSVNTTWVIARNYVQVATNAIYLPLGNGKFTSGIVSNHDKFKARRFLNSNPVFILTKPIATGEFYYLRSEYTDLSIQIRSLEDFTLSDHHNQILMGAYYGIMLGLIIYNLFVYFSLRDKSYFYYVLFILSYTLLVLLQRGQGFEYLWTDSPFWQINGTALFVTLIIVTMLQFTRSFLNLKQISPKFDRYMQFLLTGTLLLFCGFIFSITSGRQLYYQMLLVPIVDFYLVIGLLSSIISGVLCLIKKYRPARYYVLSWLFLGASTIYIVLMAFGLREGSTDTFALEFGIVGQALLLSAALTDKINIIRRQNEVNIIELAAAHKELEHHVIHLEELVKERTSEISEKNKLLEMKNIDLEEANQQIRRQEAMLVQQEKLAVLGDITASVAHEINTPLLSVQLGLGKLAKFADKLRSYFENKIDKDELLADNQFKKNYEHYDADLLLYNSSIDRIRQQIENMKSFIKFQEKTEEFNINKELETTLSIMNYSLLSKVEVIKELDSNIPLLLGNAAQINQVLMNIIKNAAEAGTPGELGRIRIKTYQNAARVIVEISDQGIGIDAEHLAKIFKVKFTTKQRGTGLGLSICREVMERHSGTIEVESELGRGTLMRLLFPIEKQPKIE